MFKKALKLYLPVKKRAYFAPIIMVLFSILIQVVAVFERPAPTDHDYFACLCIVGMVSSTTIVTFGSTKLFNSKYIRTSPYYEKARTFVLPLMISLASIMLVLLALAVNIICGLSQEETFVTLIITAFFTGLIGILCCGFNNLVFLFIGWFVYSIVFLLAAGLFSIPIAPLFDAIRNMSVMEAVLTIVIIFAVETIVGFKVAHISYKYRGAVRVLPNTQNNVSA